MRGDVHGADAARELAVLRDRARELARVPTADAPRQTVDVLVFSVGDERFAIESRYVLGVFRVTTLSLLPPAASPLIGITEWQGELLTLLDLRRALEYPAGALTDGTLALAVGERQAAFAVSVDVVHAHEPMPVSEMTAAHTGAGPAHRCIRGVTADSVLLLDAPALLGAPQSHPNGQTPRT